jgi:hypothetical protein
MRRLLVGALGFALGAIPVTAQSLEDLNIQIHGYATQGFVNTTHNNWDTLSSSDGSPAWTEAVVNVTAQPQPKLRVGVQARYFLLGNFGNTVSLDWADADYKFSEKFGVRFGKVKTPEGMFNMTQDIDPAMIWSILPQSIYPVATRTSILSHLGGVVYGTLRLPAKAGTLGYQGWAGERNVAANDPLLEAFAESGILFPSGVTGHSDGATVQWHTPLKGLMVGSSESSNTNNGPSTLAGMFSGKETSGSFQIPFYFGQYERNRLTLNAEYMRLPFYWNFNYTNGPVLKIALDFRNWYGMASYRVTNKLSVGSFFDSSINHQAPLGAARYQKNWDFSARYDLSSFLYLKAEENLLNGTGGIGVSYYPVNNTGTLNPKSQLTILKAGVSF